MDRINMCDESRSNSPIEPNQRHSCGFMNVVNVETKVSFAFWENSTAKFPLHSHITFIIRVLSSAAFTHHLQWCNVCLSVFFFFLLCLTFFSFPHFSISNFRFFFFWFQLKVLLSHEKFNRNQNKTIQSIMRLVYISLFATNGIIMRRIATRENCIYKSEKIKFSIPLHVRSGVEFCSVFYAPCAWTYAIAQRNLLRPIHPHTFGCAANLQLHFVVVIYIISDVGFRATREWAKLSVKC